MPDQFTSSAAPVSSDGSPPSFERTPTLDLVADQPPTINIAPDPAAAEEGIGDERRTIENGTVLSGRYLIEGAIGSGGMSTVFSALDRHRMLGDGADAKVAVKVLNARVLREPTRVARLIREFRYLQRLTHPGIVRVFDLDSDEGTWFITMELLQGQPLSRYLRRRLPDGLTTEEALRLLIECTEALVCAHDHGVIHGDLKPGNIFVDAAGKARLLDFGSVPESAENAQGARDRFLTPAYASPQMLEQQPADLRDDLFSLGCVAYELFSGQHPFQMRTSRQAREQGLRLTWLPSIPARHFGVIARMLAWEREERPANGREFLDSLMAAQVRAQVAFSREPRASDSEQPRIETAPHEPVPAHSSVRSEPLPPRDTHRLPEDVNRAFAQFSGVVPDDWVASRDDKTPLPPTPVADEPARERWRHAIPRELLQPKAAVAPTQPAKDPAPATEPMTASPANRVIASETREHEPARWLGWWHRRNKERADSSKPGVNPPRDSAAPVAPASAEVPARRRVSQWTLRSWRRGPERTPGTPKPHATPALAGTGRTAALAIDTLSAPSNWVPQLEWRKQETMPWPRLQLASEINAAPVVRVAIGSMPAANAADSAPAEKSEGTKNAGTIAPTESGRSSTDVRTREWKPRLATSARTLQSRAQAFAALVSRNFAKLAQQSNVALRSGWQRTCSASRSAWAGVAPALERSRTRLREQMSKKAASQVALENSVPSDRMARWREAAPALTIAGIALAAWGVLQIGNSTRSIAAAMLDNDDMAAERLQRLADLPIAMSVPELADPPMPRIAQIAPPPPQPAAGLLSFQSARIQVSGEQQMAVVNLMRDESTRGAAPFAWRIDPGTARPGVDYEIPESRRARFNDGQNVRSLYIPLKPGSARGGKDRTFTIELLQTPGSPRFGAIARTEVVIAGGG